MELRLGWWPEPCRRLGCTSPNANYGPIFFSTKFCSIECYKLWFWWFVRQADE